MSIRYTKLFDLDSSNRLDFRSSQPPPRNWVRNTIRLIAPDLDYLDLHPARSS